MRAVLSRSFPPLVRSLANGLRAGRAPLDECSDSDRHVELVAQGSKTQHGSKRLVDEPTSGHLEQLVVADPTRSAGRLSIG
jgi:hypothetical protein